MNLIHQLIKTEISKLNKKLCQDLNANDEGRKFSLLMLKKFSGYKKNRLIDCYTDGSGDFQVDGLYLVEDEEELQIHILTCCFRTNGKSIEDKDITDLTNNGLSYLLFSDNKIKPNDKLKHMRSEIKQVCKEYNQNYTAIIKFICTSDQVLSTNGENAFKNYQNDLQSKGMNIEYEKIGSKQLSAIFSSRNALKTLMPIKLSGKSYYPLIGKEGFVCRLPIQELLNIYYGFKDGKIEYPGYGEFLFDDNVRKNLGLEKKINKKIYESAINASKAIDFEYFNNGLTIIYDEKKGPLTGDSPVLTMKGLQIVNGCQTVSTLIKAKENGLLSDDIYVTCRFIKRIDDPEFIQSVITYTNSQNAITDRDLHANDKIQYEIQGILKNCGYYYERKLNEHKDEDDTIRIDALTAAQAYLCCELKEPHHAKQDKRKIFNELYHKIFDDSKVDLPYKLLLSHRILDFVIDKQAELKQKKQAIKRQGKTPRYKLEERVKSLGSNHIAANIYEQLIKGKSFDEINAISTAPTLPRNTNNIYKKTCTDLTKHVKDRNIKNDKLSDFFKHTGMCT